MRLIEYQVLLPNRFWDLARNNDELKQMIKQYFKIGYPHYEIKRIIKSGQAYIAICIRR